ncbi:DUF6884 domain-containing protein [Ktedonospora formicarum]|nr:DUF6884 domain-containing protein [Ktedonospora formicarum]
MKRLMLISCSGSKNPSLGLLPAIERYTGGVYSIIKKARREGYWQREIDILIVSAKYGLIAEDDLIEIYDQKMDKVRALELRGEVSQRLDDVLKRKNYSLIFMNMGSTYLMSIGDSFEVDRARRTGIIREAKGGIGKKLSQTKVWIKAQYMLG